MRKCMIKNLNAVKDILKSICLVTKRTEINDLMKKHKFWINTYGVFTLDKKETEKFYEVANFMRNKYNGGKLFKDVAKKDINNSLLELISKAFVLNTQQEKLKLIDNFENEFEKQIDDKIKNYEILFPILDFKINSRFTFGDIVFYPFTNYQLNKEMKFIKNIFDQNGIMTEKDKQKWVKALRKELSIYHNQSMFRGSFKGTITAAKLKSYNVVLLHINVLKLLSYDFHNKKPYQRKKINKIMPFETILKSKDGFRTMTYLPVEFSIDLKDMSFLKTKEASSLSKILKKVIKDDIEKRILASINWAVISIEKSPTQSEESFFFDSSVYMTPNKYLLSQCLLNILIAFETLLLFKKEKGKKERLKNRCVVLLENTKFGESFISDNIDKLYNLRSEIVHEGRFNDSPKSVFQLYIFFREIIFNLIKLKNKKEIITNVQLKIWLKNKVKLKKNLNLLEDKNQLSRSK